jgi:signal peptidase II
MKRWVKIVLFCLSSLTLISWDRVTKDMAKKHLADKEGISYMHDTFRLEYVENTGAAMSMGDGLSKTTSLWLLSVLPLAALLILFFYILKKSEEMSFLKLFSFTLIFSGGIGNIIDRLMFDRHVTDFMNIGFQNIRTGIFNFADVFVTCGVICLFIVFRDKRLQANA